MHLHIPEHFKLKNLLVCL